VLFDQNELEEAEACYRRVLEGKQSPDIASELPPLRAVSLTEGAVMSEQLQTLTTMNSLASLLKYQKKLPEAEVNAIRYRFS
jgi:hypothetical protein